MDAEAPVIDPVNPMMQPRGATAGDIVPSVSDPVAAQWLMLIGVAIIGATALWAFGGLAAAAWSFFAEIFAKSDHSVVEGARKRR